MLFYPISSYLGNPVQQVRPPPVLGAIHRKDQCTQVHINKNHSKSEPTDRKHPGEIEEYTRLIYRYQAGDGATKKKQPEPKIIDLVSTPTKDNLGTTKKTFAENFIERSVVRAKDVEEKKILKPLFAVKQALLSAKINEGHSTAVTSIAGFDLSRHHILLFGGIDPFNSSSSDLQGKNVLQYSVKKNNWKILSNMPGSRHHHSAIFHSGKIYIIGGTRPAYENILPALSECVWSFDPKTLQWRNEKDLPYPRRDFGLVGTKNGIYIIGGEDNTRRFLSSTILLIEGSGSWVEVAKLRTPRTGLAAALVGNEIFAAGGIIGVPTNSVTDTVESYNLTTGHWTQITSLRKPRSFGKLCVLADSRVFIAGGVTIEGNKFSSLSSIDKFDRNSKEWKKETNMQLARHGHDTIGLDDKILVFGGVSTVKNITLNSVECYSTTSKKWIDGIQALPSPLSGMAAVVFL